MSQLVGSNSLGLGKLIDGKNQFVHIMYSANVDGSNMTSDIQADTKYIGIVTSNSETAPTNPSDYSWGRFVGTSGTSSYTWLRYSPNEDGSNMTVNPTPETKYIGVAITADNNAPTDYTKYSWALIKGDDGRGISKTEVTYQKSTSGTVIPTGTWVTTIPTVNAGEYLWTRTLFTYTDNTTSSTYSVARSGVTGLGILRSDVDYQKSTSGTVAPTGAWTATIPTVAANEYLWTRTTLTYTNATTSVSYSVGKMGADGKDAQLLYLTASSQIQAFDKDDRPKTTQAITISAKLQNASGTATFTAIPYIGNIAQAAITLGGTGNDRTLMPSQWTNTQWTTIAITATLGSLTDTISVARVKDGDTGATGKDGSNGKDGVGIASTTVTYQASGSGTTAPSGTWSTTVPTVAASQYLWTRTIIDYTDSTSSTSYSVGKMGADGKDAINGDGQLVFNNRYERWPVSTNTNENLAQTGWTYNGNIEILDAESDFPAQRIARTKARASGTVQFWTTGIPVVPGTYVRFKGQVKSNAAIDKTITAKSFACSRFFPADTPDATNSVTASKIDGKSTSTYLRTSGDVTLDSGAVLVSSNIPTFDMENTWYDFDIVRPVPDGATWFKVSSYADWQTETQQFEYRNFTVVTFQKGTSVTAVVEEYYISTSPDSQAGGSWSTTVPNNADPNLYVWRRMKNTFSDGTVTYTDPALIQGMTGIYPYIGPTQPANPKEGQQWWKSDSSGNVTNFYVYKNGSWQGQTIQQSILNIVALNAVTITGSTITGTTINGSEFNNSFAISVPVDGTGAGTAVIKDGTIKMDMTVKESNGTVSYTQGYELGPQYGLHMWQRLTGQTGANQSYAMLTPGGLELQTLAGGAVRNTTLNIESIYSLVRPARRNIKPADDVNRANVSLNYYRVGNLVSLGIKFDLLKDTGWVALAPLPPTGYTPYSGTQATAVAGSLSYRGQTCLVYYNNQGFRLIPTTGQGTGTFQVGITYVTTDPFPYGDS